MTDPRDRLNLQNIFIVAPRGINVFFFSGKQINAGQDRRFDKNVENEMLRIYFFLKPTMTTEETLV